MFYMHLENVRSMADLAYWIHSHAFVVPIVCVAIAFCLVATASIRRSY